MPIQLIWMPNTPTSATSVPRLGLEIRGDDAIGASVEGRLKLIEVNAPGSAGRGTAETTAERLIATFHGRFHRDAGAPVQSRVTFEIYQRPGTSVSAHNGYVNGFDPECIFGVDAIVMTFVNREFIIWLPFHVDTRSEGQSLEVVAVAERGPAGSPTQLARSMVRTLPITRTHSVISTSTYSNAFLNYSCPLVGHQILTPTHYILNGDRQNAAVIIPVPPNGSAVAFSAYASGSMRIVLLSDLLDDVVPADSFLTFNITGVTATAVATVRTNVQTRFRNTIQNTLNAVFPDAGFAGMSAMWQNDAGAAALMTAFSGAFVRNTLRGRYWRLSNSQNPLQTSFWNFFVGSSNQLRAPTTGVAEQFHDSAGAQHTIAGQQVFLRQPVPIGGGNKRLQTPIQIKSGVFRDLLTDRSQVPRRYNSLNDFYDAVDKTANKMAMLIAHEVAHSLGLMHHSRIASTTHYPESEGSPVLSLMSADVDSGGFGTGLRFHSQAKVIWAAAFGVTPTYSDQIFQNKTWTAGEVTTVDWGDRTNRFVHAHGEESIGHATLSTVPPASLGSPPFAGTPPNVQRGTYVPPSP